MEKLTIPEKTVERLPLYLRRSEELYSQGSESATSQKFVKDLPGISSAILRKDLSYFGNYGKKGTGYEIPKLIGRLREILKLHVETKVILVGAGNLGTALLTNSEFDHWGFEITSAFDSDPDVIGEEIGGVRVQSSQDLEQVIQIEGTKMAMLAVPANNAQSVTDSIVSAGIRGILNFTPILLEVPEEITVKRVDIMSKLKELNYHLDT